MFIFTLNKYLLYVPKYVKTKITINLARKYFVRILKVQYTLMSAVGNFFKGVIAKIKLPKIRKSVVLFLFYSNDNYLTNNI
jgi:hypothetical protein